MGEQTELRRLAKAATPGPWHDIDCGYAGCWCRVVITEETMPKDEGQTVIAAGSAGNCDAAYIAAANPQTMLALLDVVDAAMDHLESLDAYPEQLVPINRKSATVRALRTALSLLGGKGDSNG